MYRESKPDWGEVDLIGCFAPALPQAAHASICSMCIVIRSSWCRTDRPYSQVLIPTDEVSAVPDCSLGSPGHGWGSCDGAYSHGIARWGPGRPSALSGLGHKSSNASAGEETAPWLRSDEGTNSTWLAAENWTRADTCLWRQFLWLELLHFEPVRYLFAQWLITVPCQWLSTGHIQASSNPSSKISQLGFISGSHTSEVNILASGLLLSGCSVFLGEGLDEEQKNRILFFVNENEFSYFWSVFYHNYVKHSWTHKRCKRYKMLEQRLFEQIPSYLAVALWLMWLPRYWKVWVPVISLPFISSHCL